MRNCTSQQLVKRFQEAVMNFLFPSFMGNCDRERQPKQDRHLNQAYCLINFSNACQLNFYNAYKLQILGQQLWAGWNCTPLWSSMGNPACTGSMLARRTSWTLSTDTQYRHSVQTSRRTSWTISTDTQYRPQGAPLGHSAQTLSTDTQCRPQGAPL